MVFMADVFVPCEICGGTRFKPDVLEVTSGARTSRELLELTVDEAMRLFPREEKLTSALWQLQRVGLGYLRLGQPATTLSGGEAQRIKIARELALPARRGGASSISWMSRRPACISRTSASSPTCSTDSSIRATPSCSSSTTST